MYDHRALCATSKYWLVNDLKTDEMPLSISELDSTIVCECCYFTPFESFDASLRHIENITSNVRFLKFSIFSPHIDAVRGFSPLIYEYESSYFVCTWGGVLMPLTSTFWPDQEDS